MFEELDSELEWLQQGKLKQTKSAAKLAFEHRRRVREGDLFVFLLPLTLAIVKDGLLDHISNVPILGLFSAIAFSFPVAIYLFIFMWGRGRWILKAVIFFVTIFGNLPVLNIIPFETASVLFAIYLAKRDAGRAQVELEKLNQAMPKLANDLRGLARQRERVRQGAAESETGTTPEQSDRPEAEPESREPSMRSGVNFRSMPPVRDRDVSRDPHADVAQMAQLAPLVSAHRNQPANRRSGNTQVNRPLADRGGVGAIGTTLLQEGVQEIQRVGSRLARGPQSGAPRLKPSSGVAIPSPQSGRR